MKKFLSLVLTLALALSLVTVSAGATDFEDDGDITYQEAIDVIAGLGIVDGYSDGTFGPDEVLTRGAAAKIICNLILGPTTASVLSANHLLCPAGHHQRLLRRHLPPHRHPDRQRLHEDAAGRPGL